MPSVELEIDVPPKNKAKRKLKAFSKMLDVKCNIRREFDTKQKEISGDELVTKTTSKIHVFVEANSTSKVRNFLLAVYSAFSSSPLVYIGNASRQYIRQSFIGDPKHPPSGYQYSSDDNTSVEGISIPVNYSSIPQTFDSNWVLLGRYLHEFNAIPSSASEPEASNIYSSDSSPIEIKQKHISSPQKQVRTKPSNIATSTPTLQQASGTLNIGNVELDKSKPKSWRLEQIRILLTHPDGIELEEEQIKDVKLYGSDFENIVDALISFNGDKEAKIEHACKEIECKKSVSKAIVRWTFKNLVEYK